MTRSATLSALLTSLLALPAGAQTIKGPSVIPQTGAIKGFSQIAPAGGAAVIGAVVMPTLPAAEPLPQTAIGPVPAAAEAAAPIAVGADDFTATLNPANREAGARVGAAVDASMASLEATKVSEPFRKYVCINCGYEYDEAKGTGGDKTATGYLPPGTRWQDIPEGWVCPECQDPKSSFTLVPLE